MKIYTILVICVSHYITLDFDFSPPQKKKKLMEISCLSGDLAEKQTWEAENNCWNEEPNGNNGVMMACFIPLVVFSIMYNEMVCLRHEQQ